MRHRGEGTGLGKAAANGRTDRVSELIDQRSEEPAPGRHRVTTQPHIPTQTVPVHDGVDAAEVAQAPAVEVGPEVTEATETTGTTAGDETAEAAGTIEVAPQVAPVRRPASIPARAQWRAGHGPRLFAATLLLFAVAGTSALALRYAETRSTSQLVSMIIGVGVVVTLWAVLIASTPQVVSLRGSVLTVRNSSGSERFDLADGLQPVDVVGEPRSSQWAVLLHRADNTSVVLRRRDVDAAVLDPIVRHYRALAQQSNADRQVRFNR